MQTTFPALLRKHAVERPGAAAMREKEYGIWQTLSWADLATMVGHIACGLHQAGLRRDEHMIVVGANRPRLYATMLAAQSLGAVPIPLYQDAAAAECVFPVNNAEVRFAFQRRAFAKPAARRHPGEGHGLAIDVVAAHLEQAIDDPKPVGNGSPGTAHQIAGQSVAHLDLPRDQFALRTVQHRQPRNGGQLGSVWCPAAVMKREIN